MLNAHFISVINSLEKDTVFMILFVQYISCFAHLISFTVQCNINICFLISFCLYRACFTHLISSNLRCNLCLWYYDQLVHFNKKINANYIVIVSGSIPILLLFPPFIWMAFDTSYDVIYILKPVLSRHQSISRGCLL